MRIDDITTNIRLRAPWEAVDLGFAMVQHHWRDIFSAWTIVLLSFAISFWIIMPNDYKAYVPILLWWFKPLYDRILLHIYSRQLFNNPLSTADVFSAIPQLIWNTGLLGALTFRRFSLSRGFNLPIWQLEQLRGKPRKERQELLHLQAQSQATWLTIACSNLEYVIIFSIAALVLMLDPSHYAKDYIMATFTDAMDEQLRYWGALIYLLLYGLAVWIIEPLYIAASFSLYLNRRTQLEAWDIELAFRSLSERLQHHSASSNQSISIIMVGLLMCIVMGSTFYPTPSLANDTPDKAESVAAKALPPSAAQAQIDAIMQRDEFNQVRTVKRWLPKKQETKVKDPSEISAAMQVLLANILKGILWITAFILVVLGIVYRRQILDKLKPRPRKTAAHIPPDILFGMDIRPESLPDDIANECRRLWRAGQHREALSLLYRGALMRLTRHDQIPIHASHTEGDILQLARQHLAGQRIAWLTAVTRAWQELAYAHRTPPDQRIEPLFEDWARFITPLPAPNTPEVIA
jgi:hypothetical protein